MQTTTTCSSEDDVINNENTEAYVKNHTIRAPDVMLDAYNELQED